MADLNYYIKSFRGAQIPLLRLCLICDSLSKETLDRLTGEGRDKRTIKPLLDMAEKMSGGITDDNVNELLDDFMLNSQLIRMYCK